MQLKAFPGHRIHDGNGSAATLPWPKPSPLVGEIERAPYPVDVLPDVIRAAVEEVQAEVQAPAEMVACSALSVLSLAGQSMADVARSKTLPGPCSLYFLTVAESGDRKSTVDRLLCRAIWSFRISSAMPQRSPWHLIPLTWRPGRQSGMRPRPS